MSQNLRLRLALMGGGSGDFTPPGPPGYISITDGPNVVLVNHSTTDVSCTAITTDLTPNTIDHYFGIWLATDSPTDDHVKSGTNALQHGIAATVTSGVEVTSSFAAVTAGISYKLHWLCEHVAENKRTRGTAVTFELVNAPPVGIPTITGTVLVGETLTNDSSGISDLDGLGTFSYQWYRDTVAISGATNQTYVIQAADEFAELTTGTSYIDGAGKLEGPLISLPTIPVPEYNRPATGMPLITGTPAYQEVLTANLSGISDPNGVPDYGLNPELWSFQWHRDGVDISGATDITYTVGVSDLLTDITVTVWFTDNAGFSEGPLTSDPVSIPDADVEYLHNFDTASLSGFTYTRASDATTHNHLGNIITVPDNVEAYPGGNYVPPWQNEGVGYGIQLEGARTNTVRNSHAQWLSGSWPQNNCDTTEDATVTTPFGENSTLVVDNAVSGWHSISGLQYPSNQPDSTVVAVKQYVKGNGTAEYCWIGVQLKSGSTRRFFVNLTTAAVSNVHTDYITATAAFAGGDGWIEVRATINVSAGGANVALVCGVAQDDNVHNYVGDGSLGFYLGGCMVEEGEFHTSAIQTGGSAVTRAATDLSAPFSALSPLPAGGVVNDFCGQITFRMLASLADQKNFCWLFAVSDGTDDEAVIAFKNSDTEIAFQSRRGGVTTNTIVSGLTINAGDVVDLRFRKASDTGMTGWVNVSNTANNPADTADLAAAVNDVRVARSPGGGAWANVEHQIARIVPAALSDDEIVGDGEELFGWPTWAEPLPIITQHPADIAFGGAPPSGDGPVFTTQPLAVATNEPEGACFTVWIQDFNYDYMEWQSDASGEWRPIYEDFPTAMSQAQNLDGALTGNPPQASMGPCPDDCDFFTLGIPQVKEGENCQIRCLASKGEMISYSDIVTLTVGPRLTFTPERPNCLYERHISYLGSFTIPRETPIKGNRDAGYSGSALAIDDNGTALYLTCRRDDDQGENGGSHTGYGKVSIPEIGGEAEWLIDSEYMIYDTTYGHEDGKVQNSEFVRGGLVWGNDIILNPSIWYDNNGNEGYTAFSVSLDLQTWGPMRRADYFGNDIKKGYVNGYMCHVPPEWQSAIGWPTLVGNCHMSIATGSPNGFSVWGFHPDQLLATSGLENTYPIEGFMAHELGKEAVARTWLEMHKTGWRDPGPCPPPNTVWQAGDDVCGMCWPEGTDTVLMVGTVGTGQNTYKIKGETASGSGRAAEPYRRQIWAFDANDFIKVKNGEIQRHEVQPYARWPLPDAAQDRPANMQPGGMTYDPVLKRIYYCEKYGEDAAVHVLQVETL